MTITETNGSTVQEKEKRKIRRLSGVKLSNRILDRYYLRRERESRNLVLDYALGISIIGLIPISGFLSVKLLITLGLIGKMIWDIGVKWEFSQGQDILAIMGYLFGCLGAFAMAFMAWLTCLGLGLFIPYISGFKIAATLFTFTWMLGQATHQFFALGHKRKMIRRKSHES